jgi:hypothetical protein
MCLTDCDDRNIPDVVTSSRYSGPPEDSAAITATMVSLLLTAGGQFPRLRRLQCGESLTHRWSLDNSRGSAAGSAVSL